MDIDDSVEQVDITEVIPHCRILCENRMARGATSMKIELPITIALELVKQCTIAIGWSCCCVRSLERVDL